MSDIIRLTAAELSAKLASGDLDGAKATEKETWSMDARIRAVAEAPDGSIWLLQDGEDAKLLELRPA